MLELDSEMEEKQHSESHAEGHSCVLPRAGYRQLPCGLNKVQGEKDMEICRDLRGKLEHDDSFWEYYK